MLEQTFKEIEIAVSNGLYSIALGMTLCIPDICAALESGNGKTEGNKYRKWYRNNVGEELFLSAEDCYFFRCAFLHQGTTEHEKMTYNKVVFTIPNEHNIVAHNNIFNDALNLDIVLFSQTIIKAAREWLIKVQDDENFKRNMNKSFKFYPNGLPPYIVGMPLYA